MGMMVFLLACLFFVVGIIVFFVLHNVVTE